MKMKIVNFRKYIFRVFIFIILLSCYSVSAKEACDDAKSIDLAARYGIVFSSDESSATIHINKSNMNTEIADDFTYFDVKVNGTSVGRIVPDGSAITINYTSYSGNAASIEFIPDSSFSDPTLESLCGKTDFSIDTDLDFGTPLDPISCSTGSFDYEEPKKIDVETLCAAPNGVFAERYCELRAKAIANGAKSYDDMNYENYGGDTFGDSKAELKCDSTKILDFNTLHGLTYGSEEYEDKYYVNKSYFYGEKIETFVLKGKDGNPAKYVHNLEVGNSDAEDVIASCDIKCTEYVEVKYGAPQASKAGLCIEYMVKVISRNYCSYYGNITTPTPYKLCQPYPVCIHSDGTIYRQGGPSTEFDSCIKKCDGGKYSASCSKKCYNDVYLPIANDRISGTEIVFTPVESNADLASYPTYSGGKYIVDGGSIAWYNGRSGDRAAVFSSIYDSPWHRTYSWGVGSRSDYQCYTLGIPKRCGCSDKCSWYGCSSGQYYLNPSTCYNDAGENQEIYNELKTKCEAAATCSTSYGEVRIQVRYDTDDANPTVYYPGPSDSDAVEAISGNKHSDSNSESPLLDINYCNNKDIENPEEYLAEWGFPGIWIGYKYGNFSWYKPTSEVGWKYVDRKWCVPRTAKSVNSKWWTWYYKTLNEVDKVSDVCPCLNESSSNPDKDDLIEGEVQDFGHFKWNFKIHCFYALPPKCDNECDINLKYQIRSIDLETPFPTSSGTIGVDRTKGFNWSDRANNTLISGFNINASTTLSNIKSRKYDIYQYDDQYLDYSFSLKSSDLAQLRRDFEGKKYGDYEDPKAGIGYDYGLQERENGMITYLSEVVTEYDEVGNDLKDRATCNNFANGSTGCEE